jgi:hypothetical protein
MAQEAPRRKRGCGSNYLVTKTDEILVRTDHCLGIKTIAEELNMEKKRPDLWSCG